MSASVDRAIAFVASVSAPVLTLLVDQHVLSALTATDIGVIIAAAVTAYHGGKAVERRGSGAAYAAKHRGEQ